MPKIEVNRDLLFKYLGKNFEPAELSSLLECAKAELAEVDAEAGTLKIELNDTNRPDLWSTIGLARQLASYLGTPHPVYSFFNIMPQTITKEIIVDKGLKEIRPYIAAFLAKGPGINEEALIDLIQSQEKLTTIFGCKRKTIAMGVYRSNVISYPVKYLAADPDRTSFVPLGMEKNLSLRQILAEHPKGIEFGHLVKDLPRFPFLCDAKDEVLSFPPIINSNNLGAVEIGDSELFVELTGSDLENLLLACSIIACDLADAGYTIEPVLVRYPYPTPFGQEVVTPLYFQKPIEVDLDFIAKLLGERLSPNEICQYLKKMGHSARIMQDSISLQPPPYRNDFLHPVDIVEEIVIGRGLKGFSPLLPKDFTAGRLTEAEYFQRTVREIMIGLGFQEMIYNYLGSRKDFLEKMGLSTDEIIEIANPMTESYELVRNSIIPCLLMSEAASAHAVYPHKIFEAGKIARKDRTANYGTVTRNHLGLLMADRELGFNEINAVVAAIMFYIGRAYSLKGFSDSRFINGRAAEIFCGATKIGILGEIHPSVLSAWGIQMPCSVAEIDLDALREC